MMKMGWVVDGDGQQLAFGLLGKLSERDRESDERVPGRFSEAENPETQNENNEKMRHPHPEKNHARQRPASA